MNQTKPTYKQQGNVGLFDSDETMEKLNKLGNPLDKLSKAVDFEMFRDTLERGLYKEKFTKVGAKPCGHHDRRELRGGVAPAQHTRREQTNQGRQRRGLAR